MLLGLTLACAARALAGCTHSARTMPMDAEEMAMGIVFCVGLWLTMMVYLLGYLGLSGPMIALVMVPSCIAAFLLWIRRENRKLAVQAAEEAAKRKAEAAKEGKAEGKGEGEAAKAAESKKSK